MKRFYFLIVAIIISQISIAQSYNFQQASDAFDAEDYDKALEYFSRELNDNPDNSMAYFYRASIYCYQEKYSSALTDINNSIKYLNSKDKIWLAASYQLRGYIYTIIEEYDKAFNDYASAIKLSPDDVDLYIDRAQIYYDLKKFDKSEVDYLHVLKIDEGNVRGWAGLGRNYLAMKKYDDAEKTLNKLIKLAPDYPGGFYYLGLLYDEQKKYDEAINAIFQCFLLDESDQQVRDIFITFSKNNISLAMSKVNSQISANPLKGNWYFIRAQLFEGENNFAYAIKDYNKLMELYDISYKSSILYYRAKCYADAGMYENAISDFSESLSIDSTDAYTFGYRADVKRLTGDYASAVEDFTRAINLEPREEWFYYRRGWTKEFMQDFDGALIDYNEAISINKEYIYTYLNRGRLFESKLNNTAKAKEDYLTILSLDTVAEAEGNCHQYALFHLGRNEEAIEWMNKIIKLYPTNGNYYEATCLYSLMNKPKEAISYLNLAFQKGYRDFIHISVDDDLDNIRNLPEFINLIKEWENIFNESLIKESSESPKTTDNISESVTIPMTPKGSGIYEVSCKVNDLRLNFIFDTGASDISISQTEALFMIKNGYLNTTDIVGSQSYMDANGDIEIGTKIILRKVEFGGLVIKNVTASVINNKNAPLLFGQSALSKYGKIIIDNQNNTITIITDK